MKKILLCFFSVLNIFPENNILNKIFSDYFELYKSQYFSSSDSDNIKHLGIYFNDFIKNNSELVEYVKNNDVIDTKFLNNINFIYNSNLEKNVNFIDIVNRCKTLIGKYILSIKLANPTDNIEDIINNQNIIKFFIQNEDIKTELNDILSELSKIEKSLMDFYDKNSKFYNIEKDKDLLRRFYFKNRNNSNRSVKSLYFKKFFNDIWHILIKPYFSGAGTALYLTSFIFTFNNLKGKIPLLLAQLIPIPFLKEIFILLNIKEIFNSLNDKKSIICGALFVGGLITSIFSYIRIYKKYKEYRNRYNEIAEKIKDLQINLNIMNIVLGIIKNNPELNTYFANKIKNIEYLIEKRSDDKNIKFLVDFLLKVDSNSWYYLSRNASKVLAIFKIFCDNKDIITNAICELGEVDSYLSMCNLINEKPNEYSFTKFLKDKDKPILKQKDIWNYFLKSENIVKNDVTIGDDYKTMLLCGHNGGGKSVYILSTMINILLSQTYGISCSSNSEMTLFSKILYLSNTSDDISKGRSLYKSEILKLKDYVDLCNTLPKDKYIFTIMDEPLKGTDSKSSVAILKGILKYLSKNNNNILSIISTHFDELTYLDEIKSFKNYYPAAFINEKNEIKYSYKIIPGKINLSLALLIAENSGIKKDVMSLVKEEYDILK